MLNTEAMCFERLCQLKVQYQMSDRNNMIDLIHLHGVLLIQTYVIYSIGWWWVYIKLGWPGCLIRMSETIKEITILGAEIWHLPISTKERHRSETMNESTVVLNRGSMCALILLFKIEVNISVFVSGQNNDTWNYVWLGEFGQVSSRST